MKMCHKMKVYRRIGNRPEIRLLGNWLDKIGFSIGSEICVTILDDRILIERNARSENDLNEIAAYFEKEGMDKAKSNILPWVRAKGGINPESKAADIFSLTQKQSGYKGRSSVIRKNGRALDELTQEAIWEGIIAPGTGTDDFSEMIKGEVQS